MVVPVGSSVPILYQNLACPPRYPLRKGKRCRCRVEPGVLPTILLIRILKRVRIPLPYSYGIPSHQPEVPLPSTRR